MLGSTVYSCVNYAIGGTDFAKTETFASETGDSQTNGRMAVVSLITVFILLLLILFVGKWLWNDVLVSLVPGVKPAKSIYQILGLAILIMLLSPGGCNC
jgi:hypothetical protein